MDEGVEVFDIEEELVICESYQLKYNCFLLKLHLDGKLLQNKFLVKQSKAPIF